MISFSVVSTLTFLCCSWRVGRLGICSESRSVVLPLPDYLLLPPFARSRRQLPRGILTSAIPLIHQERQPDSSIKRMPLNTRLKTQVTLFTNTSKFTYHQNLENHRGLLFIPSFYTHEHGVQRFDPNSGNPPSTVPTQSRRVRGAGHSATFLPDLLAWFKISLESSDQQKHQHKPTKPNTPSTASDNHY